MKKLKLQLNRQTLRTLADRTLNGVQGGLPGSLGCGGDGPLRCTYGFTGCQNDTSRCGGATETGGATDAC
jgi:hypothetical protein